MFNKQYKYGIFARIRRGWTVNQVKMYMDQNDIEYDETNKMEDLVEVLKCHEDLRNL